MLILSLSLSLTVDSLILFFTSYILMPPFSCSHTVSNTFIFLSATLSQCLCHTISDVPHATSLFLFVKLNPGTLTLPTSPLPNCFPPCHIPLFSFFEPVLYPVPNCCPLLTVRLSGLANFISEFLYPLVIMIYAIPYVINRTYAEPTPHAIFFHQPDVGFRVSF